MYFNSHPHEEDDDIRQCFLFLTHISTHILTKRMTEWICYCWRNRTFQLTSSRRGWRTSKRNSFSGRRISTHILTKRMTASILYGCISTYISTHILTKRMTARYKILPEDTYISTHILTKRMTKSELEHILRLIISTHILTKRMTIYEGNSWAYQILFQLTSSRRGWRWCCG